MVHVIAYDLHERNDTAEDYERVIDAIREKFRSRCHVEKSVWLVDTSLNAGEVRDFMKTCVSEKDSVFVARLSGNWASSYLGDERANWLKARTF